MKITYNFDPASRSFSLIPEDALEECLLKDMAERSEKGTQIVLRSIETSIPTKTTSYRVEMKVNGV